MSELLQPPASEIDHDQFEYCPGAEAKKKWGEKQEHYYLWSTSGEWVPVSRNLRYNNDRLYRRPRTEPRINHFI